jgi:hypothetical protein
MEVNDKLLALATLTPGKEPSISIEYEAVCCPEPVWTPWRREKYPLSATAGNRTPVVHIVVYEVPRPLNSKFQLHKFSYSSNIVTVIMLVR